MQVFRLILIVVALVLTALNADEKDIIATVMWSGLFFMNLTMFAIEAVKDHIDKK